MIFSFALNERSGTRMLKYVYLSWVCQRWRDLLLNAPTFWSELDLNCRSHTLLQTILHRSRNASLSVSVGGPDYPLYDDASHQIVALENFVFPNMDRLYSLSLKLSCLRYNEIYAPLRRSAPELKHLQLYRAIEDVIPWSPSYHQMEYNRLKDIDLDHLFDNACSLESLTFDMPQPFPWSTFEPMISNIKELTLRTVTWDFKLGCLTHTTLLTFLNQCPTLESLELKTIPDPSFSNDIKLNSPKPSQIINLPRLSKLILGASQDVALLAYITTSKLQVLHLHLNRRPIPNPSLLTNHILDSFDVSSLRSAVIVDGQSLMAYPDLVRVNNLLEPVGTTTSFRLKYGTSTLAITSESARTASAFILPLLAAMSSLERLITSSSDTITNNSSITTTNTTTIPSRHLHQLSVSDTDTLKSLKIILANQFTKRQSSFRSPFALFQDHLTTWPRLSSIVNL